MRLNYRCLACLCINFTGLPSLKSKRTRKNSRGLNVPARDPRLHGGRAGSQSAFESARASLSRARAIDIYTKPREREFRKRPLAPGESEPGERAPGNAASSNKRASKTEVRQTQRIDSHSCLIKISRARRHIAVVSIGSIVLDPIWPRSSSAILAGFLSRADVIGKIADRSRSRDIMHSV